MMKYDGREYDISLGKTRNDKYFNFRVPPALKAASHTSLIASSGLGKSAIGKHIAVQTSEIRPIIVLDYNSEWRYHITKMSNNPYCRFPDKITNYKVFENIGCTVSELASNENSIKSLGFTEEGIKFLDIIINEGFKIHEDSIPKLTEMINRLPAEKKEVHAYNLDFGLDLPGTLHPSIVQSIKNHWHTSKKWFYDPHNKSNDLNHYDFDKIILYGGYDHFIFDFFLRGKKSHAGRSMALAGYVLSRLRKIQHKIRAAYFIEEARFLMPEVSGMEIIPSSVQQIFDMLTLDRKSFAQVFLLMQSEDMIYEPALEHLYARIMGRNVTLKSNKLLMKKVREANLRWTPRINLREMYYADKTGNEGVFMPEISCCEVS